MENLRNFVSIDLIHCLLPQGGSWDICQGWSELLFFYSARSQVTLLPPDPPLWWVWRSKIQLGSPALGMIGLPTADKVTDWGISQGDAKQDGWSTQNITLSKENWATLSWLPLFELCMVGLPLVVTHRTFLWREKLDVAHGGRHFMICWSERRGSPVEWGGGSDRGD